MKKSLFKLLFFLSLSVFFITIGIILVEFIEATQYPRAESWGFAFVGLGFSSFLIFLVDFIGKLVKRGYFGRFSNLLQLIRNAKIEDGMFDVEHEGRLVRLGIRKALDRRSGEILLMGTTLKSVLGIQGILTKKLTGNSHERYSKKLRGKKIKVLIINPYSQHGIIRSIVESSWFQSKNDNKKPYQKFLDHSLSTHKGKLLFRDFQDTTKFLLSQIETRNSLEPGVEFECRIYNHSAAYFAICCNDFALAENLIFSAAESNDKRQGGLPLVWYNKGKVRKAVENHFRFIWENLSTPIKDFSHELESKHFTMNQFFILLNLQARYWDDQWNSYRNKINKHKALFNMFNAHLDSDEKTPVENLEILDLGCGNGGGGSYELHKKAIEMGWTLESIDVSEGAIKQFQFYMEKDAFNKPNYKPPTNIFELLESKQGVKSLEGMPDVTFDWCDILTYLRKQKDNSFDYVFSNLAIIYMPRYKAMEIFRHIYRVLKSNGEFFGGFWNENYFKIPDGNPIAQRERPSVEFIRVPAPENLQIITKGDDRTGEIRRFYKNMNELKMELTGEGEVEGNYFDIGKINATKSGDKDQLIIVRAEKSR